MPDETFETEMNKVNKAPALRISHIVRDPINVDGGVGTARVSYPRFDPLRDEFQPCRPPSPNTSAS